MNPRDDKQVRRYTFGALSFTITGLGMYLGCDKLRSKIAALTPSQVVEANREAWKQRKPLEREAARKNNVTIWGWDDARDAHIQVCQTVCKETFKAMRRAA